ncbi:MAG: hypothetical protein KJ072_20165 [Verrucomicrobia bacterium]|nr:hypothetical protein [Verrucomicrobiota bacterium]
MTHPMVSHETAARPGLTPEDLVRCCQDSGWAYTERVTGRLTVALETEPLRHAELVAQGESIFARVELADYGRCGAPSRQAAAALLHAAATVVRRVRASVVEEVGGAVWLRFEAECGPVADALGISLESLSVVVAMVAPELAALENETIARDYLAVRECFADDGKQPKT